MPEVKFYYTYLSVLLHLSSAVTNISGSTPITTHSKLHALIFPLRQQDTSRPGSMSCKKFCVSLLSLLLYFIVLLSEYKFRTVLLERDKKHATPPLAFIPFYLLCLYYDESSPAMEKQY